MPPPYVTLYLYNDHMGCLLYGYRNNKHCTITPKVPTDIIHP